MQNIGQIHIGEDVDDVIDFTMFKAKTSIFCDKCKKPRGINGCTIIYNECRHGVKAT